MEITEILAYTTGLMGYAAIKGNTHMLSNIFYALGIYFGLRAYLQWRKLNAL